MTDKNQTFTVCGEELSAPMHICGFFDSTEERYEVILPYIAEGLKNHEKVIPNCCQHCYTQRTIL